MPSDGKEFFSPVQFRKEEEPLEQRLLALEAAMIRLRDNQRVVTDPATGQVIPDDGGSLGQGGGSGGDEGGGPSAIVAHEVFNNAYHNDAETAVPVSQDVPVVNASGRLALLAIGSAGRLLKVVGGLVTWAFAALSELSDASLSSVTRGDMLRRGATAWNNFAIGVSGRVLKSDGTDPTWGQVAHSELTGVTANDHHNQAHELASSSALGADHTVSGLTTGHVLKATGAAAAAFGELQHSQLGGVGANDHHNQAHSFVGADHTVSGTEGHLPVVQSGGASVALEAPGTHVIRAGVHASRPAANSVPAGTLYLSTNQNGGTLYRSTGSAWEQCGLGVTEAPGAGASISVKEGGGSATTGVSTLDFGAGFDLTPGAETDINLDLSEVANGGDLTFTGNSPVITAFNGVVANLPAIGNPGSMLYVNNSSEWDELVRGAEETILWVISNQLAWASLDTILSSGAVDARCVAYSNWRELDISDVGTTPVEMSGFDGGTSREVMPAAGKILGISVICSGDIGTAGDEYTVTVYKQTTPGGAFSATTVTATITGDASTEDRAYSGLAGAVTFNAGDALTVYQVETATLAAVDARVTVYVKFNV